MLCTSIHNYHRRTVQSCQTKAQSLRHYSRLLFCLTLSVFLECDTTSLQNTKMRLTWSVAAGISYTAAVSLADPFTRQQMVAENSFGIPGQNATYDYVIVGGGTGGLAVAYRLAEDAATTVAVVEAGGFYEIENGNVSVVPAYNQEYNYITADSQWDAPLVDWGFLTTPQAGAQDQVFHYGRGKMLGGW